MTMTMTMTMQAMDGAGLHEGAVAPNHAGFGVASRMDATSIRS